MISRKIDLESLDALSDSMHGLGAKNTEMMALRGIHRNVLVKDVPGAHARVLKRHYNDVGAEVAISHDAWLEKNGAVTDILVMGSLYQHNEVRAALATSSALQDLLNSIKSALD